MVRRNACKNLYLKLEGKGHKCRWGDTIEMDVKEIGFECGGQDSVTQERVQWWAG
jgi:hypothetical protein